MKIELLNEFSLYGFIPDNAPNGLYKCLNMEDFYIVLTFDEVRFFSIFNKTPNNNNIVSRLQCHLGYMYEYLGSKDESNMVHE